MSDPRDFTAEAELAPTSFVREVFQFLRDNKKWWLIPVVLVLLILGTLIVVGGTAGAPFIYTLF
jgi:hypothetical protein